MKITPNFDLHNIKKVNWKNKSNTSSGKVNMPISLDESEIIYPDNYIPHVNGVEALYNSLQDALFNYYEYLFIKISEIIGEYQERGNLKSIGDYIEKIVEILNSLTGMNTSLTEQVINSILNSYLSYAFTKSEVTVQANESIILLSNNTTGYYVAEIWNSIQEPNLCNYDKFLRLRALIINKDTMRPLTITSNNTVKVITGIPVIINNSIYISFRDIKNNIIQLPNNYNLIIYTPILGGLKNLESISLQEPLFFFENLVDVESHTHVISDITDITVPASILNMLNGLEVPASIINNLSLLPNNIGFYQTLSSLNGLTELINASTLNQYIAPIIEYCNNNYTGLTLVDHLQNIYNGNLTIRANIINSIFYNNTSMIRHNLAMTDYFIYIIPTTSDIGNIYTINPVSNNFAIIKLNTSGQIDNSEKVLLSLGITSNNKIDIVEIKLNETISNYDRTISGIAAVYPDRYPDDISPDILPQGMLYAEIIGNTITIKSNSNNDNDMLYDISVAIFSPESVIEYGISTFDDINGIIFDMSINNRNNYLSSKEVFVFPIEQPPGPNSKYWIERDTVNNLRKVMSSNMNNTSFIWFIPKKIC